MGSQKSQKHCFPILSFMGHITYLGCFLMKKAQKRPCLVVLVGFNLNSALSLVTFATQNLGLIIPEEWGSSKGGKNSILHNNFRLPT